MTIVKILFVDIVPAFLDLTGDNYEVAEMLSRQQVSTTV